MKITKGIQKNNYPGNYCCNIVIIKINNYYLLYIQHICVRWGNKCQIQPMVCLFQMSQ